MTIHRRVGFTPTFALLFFFLACHIVLAQLASIDHASGPVSSTVSDIEIMGDQEAYALGDRELFHSTDGGDQWDYESLGEITGFGPNEIEVAADRGIWIASDSGLLWRNAGGKSWNRVSRHTFRTFRLFRPGVLFGINSKTGELLRSSNDGVTFESVGLSRDSTIGFAIGPDGTLWRVMADEVERSIDEGLTWATHGNRLPSSELRGIVPSGEGDALLIANTGIYRMANSESTWSRIADSPSQGELLSSGVTPDGLYYALWFSVELYRPQFFFGYEGGTEWKWANAMKKSISHTHPLAVSHFSSGRIIFAGYHSTRNWPVPEIGIIQSTEDSGTTWSLDVATILPVAWVENIWGDNAGNIYVNSYPGGWTLRWGGKHTLLRSGDGGRHWIPISPRPFPSDVSLLSDGTLFCIQASGDMLPLMRSTDSGDTWQSTTPPREDWYAYYDILELPGGRLIVEIATGGRGDPFYVSDDRGLTWDSLSWRSHYAKSHTHHAETLASAVGFDGTLYTMTFIGVYSSRDGGRTWSDTILSPSRSENPFIDMVLTSDDRVWVVTRYGDLYVSNDQGRHWEFSSGLDSLQVHAFSADSSGSLYLGVDDGRVLRRTDESGAWTEILALPYPARIHSLACLDGYLWVGTKGDGLWRVPIGSLSVDEESDPGVERIDLR